MIFEAGLIFKVAFNCELIFSFEVLLLLEVVFILESFSFERQSSSFVRWNSFFKVILHLTKYWDIAREASRNFYVRGDLIVRGGD